MTLPNVDVLLVLTALTVFVGVRTLALVRSRRASRGRRVIVAAALRPRPAASRPAAAHRPAPAPGDAQAALPTRRSLRGSSSGAPATLSTLSARTVARHDGPDGPDGPDDAVAAPSARLLPPPPRGRPSRRGERQPSSHRSAA